MLVVADLQQAAWHHQVGLRLACAGGGRRRRWKRRRAAWVTRGTRLGQGRGEGGAPRRTCARAGQLDQGMRIVVAAVLQACVW